MDAIDELKVDLRQGRIPAERLIDLLGSLQRQLESAKRELESAKRELQAAKQRMEELEKPLGGGTPAAAVRVEKALSMRAEEKLQQQRRKKRKRSKKGGRGRLTTADQIKLAERTEKVFPEGVPQQDGHLCHTRPVWRLEKGRAVLAAYEIYRGPGTSLRDTLMPSEITHAQIPAFLGDRWRFFLCRNERSR